MDPEAEAVIAPHLLAREVLLWCGRPRDTSALRWRAAAIVIVAAAALALRAMPLDPGLAVVANGNSILLAIVVVVLIVEAVVFHAYFANTFYGVTNQRVIILSGLREAETVAVLLDRLNAAQLRLRRIHRDIELRAPSDQVFQMRYLPFTNPSVRPDWSGWTECYRLLALEDAVRVNDLIVEAAHKLK
jgi:hypothetical protein